MLKWLRYHTSKICCAALLICTLGNSSLHAQVDSTTTETPPALISGELETENFKAHPPRRATLYSAIMPGLGQIYNRKYWKLPIVYGLLGYTIWNASRKSILYNDLREAYADFPNPVLEDSLLTTRDKRDRAYVFVLAAYILQIIDANVDAHLFHFDVSEDLSLYILPYSNPAAQVNFGLSLTLKL